MVRTMRNRMVFVPALLGLAIAGILLLVSASNDEEALEVSPVEVHDLPEGTPVAVTGVVSQEGVRDLGGFSSLRLEDGRRGDLPVFMTFPPPGVDAGDLVRAVGTVAVYKGSIEVMVEDARDIEVLRRCPCPRASLTDILEDPMAFDGREPIVHVLVLTSPAGDGTGSGWWFGVAAPSQPEGVRAIARSGAHLDPSTVEPGGELELRVDVRYDPSTGLVYLEVLSAA